MTDHREDWWTGLALVAATMSALDGVFTWLGLIGRASCRERVFGYV